MRIDYQQFSRGALQAMLALEQHLSACGFDHTFMHLLKLRASQINGCAYCIDMHGIDARAAGETEQRLYALDAWRDTPFFDDRERAGLEFLLRHRRAARRRDVELVLRHPIAIHDGIVATMLAR